MLRVLPSFPLSLWPDPCLQWNWKSNEGRCIRQSTDDRNNHIMVNSASLASVSVCVEYNIIMSQGKLLNWFVNTNYLSFSLYWVRAKLHTFLPPDTLTMLVQCVNLLMFCHLTPQPSESATMKRPMNPELYPPNWIKVLSQCLDSVITSSKIK